MEYKYFITEQGVTTGFFHIQYGIIKGALTNRILNITTNITRVACMNNDKYDFISLVLLGIRYVGGLDFVTNGYVANDPRVPLELYDTNEALHASTKYLSNYITLCKGC